MFSLLLIAVICLTSACTAHPSDITEVVDEIIAGSNEFISSKGYRNVSLPDILNGNWFVRRHFSSGYVYDLATIQRIGSVNMTTKSQGTMTKYNVEANIGLESLAVEYHYLFRILWIFKTSGHLMVKVNKNLALAKAELVTDTSSRACALLSKDVDLLLMDDIEVTIPEGGFIKGLVARSLKFLLRLFLPNLMKVVNSELDEFNENFPLNPELTRYVCKYFIEV